MIDRATGLFRWSIADVRRLARRVARLQVPASERPMLTKREPSMTTGAAHWCVPCSQGDHSHALARVGPYDICRCLHCKTLTVEDER